ncbi:response regulator [Azospirillum thermophilum]|uniref:Response regulator n=1 Tax=Azospirillum thermophilum TaxID=2202148 RepID=A0A2S2CXD4_9PROT|nr:response regulator [Azospirillum thermophilum]AWK89184.1 response regulator [Azospirillum thermophilum]
MGADDKAQIILVVEDNVLMRKLFIRCLEEAGYSVVEAQDARTVMDLMREVRPDLVVMDILMPDLSGMELIKQIRADSDLAPTPVVAVTNLATPADKRRLADAGFTGHVSKPIKPKEFQGSIAAFLKAAPTPAL